MNENFNKLQVDLTNVVPSSETKAKQASAAAGGNNKQQPADAHQGDGPKQQQQQQHKTLAQQLQETQQHLAQQQQLQLQAAHQLQAQQLQLAQQHAIQSKQQPTKSRSNAHDKNMLRELMKEHLFGGEICLYISFTKISWESQFCMKPPGIPISQCK